MDKIDGTAEREYCEIIVKETRNKKMAPFSENIFTIRKNMAKFMLDDDTPRVSILVLGFNNLEKYTKICVESILKHTGDIDFELVLVDNGSSDGTFEYYQAVPHKKKRIVRVTENNGPMYGSLAGLNCMRGQYIVCIPNDVFVTKNWLSNMIKCAESDDRIGFIVPASDNISNLQSVNLGFTNYDEMQAKAEMFNVSDPRKWEERLRVVNAVTFLKKECLDIIGGIDYGFLHDFGDDDLSFRVRRAGYKVIFCKDVFVHHAGSVVTGINQKEKLEILEKGRETFQKKYYGIDSWQDAINYELTMMSLLDPEEKAGAIKPEILGIDVMCGTPILQLKNELKLGNVFNARLSAFTQDPKFWLDLKTICEGNVKVDRVEYLLEHFENKFDYILLGKPLNTYKDPYKLLNDMINLLNQQGHLFLKIRNIYDARAFLNILGKGPNVDGEIASHVDINILFVNLKELGCLIKKIAAESHQVDENTANYIIQAVKNSGVVENTNDICNKMLVKDYVLDIIKHV